MVRYLLKQYMIFLVSLQSPDPGAITVVLTQVGADMTSNKSWAMSHGGLSVCFSSLRCWLNTCLKEASKDLIHRIREDEKQR